MRSRVVVAVVVMVASCSSSRRNAEPEPSTIRWDTPIEVARGGGQRGEWRQNASHYDYVDDPSVALDARGNTLVAWVDQARKDVFVQRFTREGRPALPAPLNVSRTPEVFSWLPRVAVRGDDVYVLWQEIVFSGGTHGGEAFLAYSRDGGATFAAAHNLSRSRNGDGKGRIQGDVWHNGSLDLALGSDGMVYAAWTEYDGPLWLAWSADRGATFSAPQRIDNGPAPARAPALAVDRSGRVYLAWTVGEDASADLRLAVSTDRGASFGTPSLVARTPGYSDAPKLAIDAAETLHVAWAESSAGPFDRFTVHYARSRDRGRTFEPPRPLSRAAAPKSSAFPMLAVDDRTVVVSWERYATARAQPRGLAVAYSLDGGSSFAAPAAVAHSADPAGGTNGSHQGRLMQKLALRDGRVAIGNSALVPGRGSRVWLVHGALPARLAARR